MDGVPDSPHKTPALTQDKGPAWESTPRSKIAGPEAEVWINPALPGVLNDTLIEGGDLGETDDLGSSPDVNGEVNLAPLGNSLPTEKNSEGIGGKYPKSICYGELQERGLLTPFATPKVCSMAEVGASSLNAPIMAASPPLAQRGFGDLDIEQSLDPGGSTADDEEMSSEKSFGRGSHVGDFQELLQAAVRQSDAERALERITAISARNLRPPAIGEHGVTKYDQIGMISAVVPSNQPANNCIQSKTIQPSDAESGAGEINVDSAESGCPSSLTPAMELDLTKPCDVVERRWVKYFSPEGYAYMYDEVTGESEWVISSEAQDQQPVAQALPHTDASGAAQEGGHNVEQHGRMDSNDDESIGWGTPAGEGDSIDTCKVSQWSRDTSGPDARNSAGETAMHLAAGQRSLRGLTLLLANGASVNVRDDRGQTPLHAVCASCQDARSTSGGSLALQECVELILSSGALEDARDVNGQTALHLAALSGNLGAVRVLLAAGAAVVADDTGNSPLHLAAAQGHADVIQLLVVADKAESRTIPSAPSDAEIQERERTPAVVAELRPAIDVSLSSSGRGIGATAIRHCENALKATDEEGVDDDEVAARIRAARQRQPCAEDLHSNASRRYDEGISRDGRDFHPRHGGRKILSLSQRKPAHRNDHRDWIGVAPLNVRPTGQDHLAGPERALNERAGVRRQDHPKGCSPSSGSPAPSDFDSLRHRRPERNGARKYSSIRRLRRRHDASCGRNNRTLHWPDALPARTYEQVLGAAFAGKGSSSQAPSRSSLYAALFASCLASRPNDAAAVLQLLEMNGGGIEEVADENGRTPLHHVCRANNVRLARLLCQAGADASMQDSQGNTPLMVAAATGSLACLQLLVQEGNDVNCFNYAGDTSLHVSVRHGNLSCVKILVESGAWLGQRNTLGLTPKEDLLNSIPLFTGGRLPTVLRTTLEYIEYTEALGARPRGPTWTANDGYGSEVTATSCHSPDGSRRENHESGFKPFSERREQQLSASSRRGTASEEKKSMRSKNAKRWDHKQECKPREQPRGGGVHDGQSDEDRSTAPGGTRRRSDVEVSMRHARAAGESRGGISEKEPSVDNGAPSRIRAGIWSMVGSVVGRALDALIGGGNDSSVSPHATSGSEQESSGCEQDHFAHRRRPPTDTELRARVAISPWTKRRSQQRSGVTGHATFFRGPEFEPLSTTEQVTMKVPISLTPMQPPPDVLAAMKGRTDVGHPRPRFSTPPADVAVALEEMRRTRKHGPTRENGTSDGPKDM